jgi:hypothetical protein
MKSTSITLDTIEIISQELNAARLQIQPSLGRQHLHIVDRRTMDSASTRSMSSPMKISSARV